MEELEKIDFSYEDENKIKLNETLETKNEVKMLIH